MFRNSTIAMMRQTALFSGTSACLAAKKTLTTAPNKKESNKPTTPAASSRFKSTPLQSTKDVSKGTTPASKIFAKSFFSTDDKKKSDEWLNLDDSKDTPVTISSSKRGGTNSAAVTAKKRRRGTTAHPQLRPAGVRRPFSIRSDTDKATYRKAVRRNLLALRDTKAAADIAKKSIERLTKKKNLPSAKNTATRVKRVHSSFYSDTALRLRGGSGSVATPKTKKKPNSSTDDASSNFVDDHIHSAHKPLNGSDGMNPLVINQSFFTSYERRQFDRLKQATRSMRLRFNRNTGTIETVSQSDVRRRFGMYRMWDKLLLNVKNVDASTPVVGLGKKYARKN